MATHDYTLANQVGSDARTDLNNLFQAIVSQNSSATEPATMYAYMFWMDTSIGILKQRNAANNAWVESFVLKTSATGSAQIPSGTTAQRGTPPAYSLRGNSDYTKLEFTPDGTNWSGLGGATGAGGDDIFYENGQTVTTDYTITTGKNAMTAGPVTINSGITVTIPTGSTWSIV